MQALLNGFITLHKKIEHQSLRTVPWYGVGSNEPVPVPILGPDLIDPRQAALIKAESARPRPVPEPAPKPAPHPAAEPAADAAATD